MGSPAAGTATASQQPSSGSNNHYPTPSSLPPSQIARLQPHAFLLAHLSPPASSNQPPVRANGRSPAEFRVTSANAGSLTHTNGSAVVRIGDKAAVCGVRAELLYTQDVASWGVSKSSSSSSSISGGATQGEEAGEGEDEEDDSQIRDLHLLVPNLSLSTGCAPGFIPGAPPSALAQSLSHQILSLLHTSRMVRADDLRIWYHPPNLSALERETESHERMDTGEEEEEEEGEEGSESGTSEIKAFWVLYIDVLIISLAGNPFDAAWAAVLAALRDTKLPRAWWNVDNDMVLCSDDASEAKKLHLRGMPIASSYCVFEADPAASWRPVVIPGAAKEEKDVQGKKRSQQSWVLADPDGYEENLCQERICVVVDQDRGGKTKVLRIEKNGGLSVGKEELRKLVNISIGRWNHLKSIIEALR
ncbi:hypothetical protein Egran_05406 [Elaphomyces granulatus]|uniref:Ribosomal RNA-processing protein 43 n=1 Tax=Elaphomyces granulatus TaxID=519963 RepID=A0A232LSN2_9EURO|nr:hypothetical protein Egran_05406 [Elaphomyces granulatus]